jgi:hypothetical protein
MIAMLTQLRLIAALMALLQVAAARPAFAAHDGQHDFDFEFGSWTAHLRRLIHPLTGSRDWIDYSGTNVDRKVWGGRANLAELEVRNDTTAIEGLSLRLYDPQMHLWSIYFANSRTGSLGSAMVGSFNGGRGEFYDNETFDGKPIRVRFIFDGITSSAFRFEQSFSADGGKTWEVNWIADFRRS